MQKGKLEALQQREAALKAAIAAEKVKQQQQKERDKARLSSIIGGALVDQANSSPQLHTMLKQVLTGCVTDPPARKFLEERNWI